MRQKDIKRSDESTYIGKHQSIDAGVIKFKGRCFERQYMYMTKNLSREVSRYVTIKQHFHTPTSSVMTFLFIIKCA